MPPAYATELPPLREALQQFFRLLKLIRSYWWQLLKGMALGVVLGLFGMVLPFISKLLIDEVYPTGDVTLMHVLVGGMLAISLAEILLGGIRGYFTQYVTSHLTSATHLFFFNHLQHLPARFFEEHRVGELVARFGDVRDSLGIVSAVFQTLLMSGVYLLLVPPFLFLLHWKLAILALITVPFTVLVTVMSAPVIRRFWKRSAEASAELNAHNVEVLSHIRTLKSMALEPQVYASTAAQARAALQVRLTAGALGHIFGSVNGVVRAIGTALYTWYAWRLIIVGDLTLGSYIAFVAYIGYLYNPLSQLTNLFSDFQRSAVSLGRMFEYLDTPTEQDAALSYVPRSPVRHKLQGEIRFQNVSFGYKSGQFVLRMLDLHIPQGQVTAVVGRSGVGKTSLLRLITRIEDPSMGHVLLDGTPSSGIPLPDLRRQVAVVGQEVSLLRGTIWDNLTLGTEDPSAETVDEIVRLCQLEPLIAACPEGYDTAVGEWGSNLSGGQRQRIALVRALVLQTPILLLDEATSNIDPETERAILRGLFLRREATTVVLVTHRISAAALAGRIAVLEDGAVVAQGGHAELLEESESYRQLAGASETLDRDRRLRVLGSDQ